MGKRTKKRILKKKAKVKKQKLQKTRNPYAASAQFRTGAGAMKTKKSYSRKKKHSHRED
jgi:hypothetical protein